MVMQKLEWNMHYHDCVAMSHNTRLFYSAVVELDNIHVTVAL